MFTDKILQKLIKKYPVPKFVDRSKYLFEDLLESIVSQQLSVKASDTIFKRFKSLFVQRYPERSEEDSSATPQHDIKKTDNFPTPQQILTMSNEKIREAGISFQKISYIKSVADAFVSDLIDVEKIKKMTDEEVIAALTQIRGVGQWTAEMILIFTLNRPDIFSVGDLGLRNAIKNLYGITDKKDILELSESWKPHRSTASWYLWRSLENS